MASDSKSLCKWKSGDIKDGTGKFKKLVKDARYFCRKCGRSARQKRNLCKPEAL